MASQDNFKETCVSIIFKSYPGDGSGFCVIDGGDVSDDEKKNN